jgi:hypothetical protein
MRIRVQNTALNTMLRIRNTGFEYYVFSPVFRILDILKGIRSLRSVSGFYGSVCGSYACRQISGLGILFLFFTFYLCTTDRMTSQTTMAGRTVETGQGNRDERGFGMPERFGFRAVSDPHCFL